MGFRDGRTKAEARILVSMMIWKVAVIVVLSTAAAIAQPKKPAKKAAPRPDAQAPAQVQRWMRGMSLHDKVAQLIVVPCYGESRSTRSREFQQYQHQRWVRNIHVGGLIVLGRTQNGAVRLAEPYAMAVFLNRMQRYAKVPLLVAADFERGASMRVDDAPKFPHNMAFAAARDLEASRFEGAETAREARALGIHWVFAPDADVNNNPDNPIINIRSYGENPKEVAQHVEAYIEGAHSDPKDRILITAKHFPGHGDTNVDTHLGLARLTADKARVESVEMVPFRAAIDHGVDAIMTAHVAVPALEPEEIPATVSFKILTEVLRQEMGFRGLIVTDAMDMQGLTQQFAPGEASVRALEAGTDVLLMPPKPEESIRAVLAAVSSGRLTRKRIDQSVTRVLAAKVRVGLARQKLVDLEQISDVLESPEAGERAQNVADRAVTLVRNEGELVPLRQPANTCMLVLTEGRYSLQGRKFVEEVRKRAPKMNLALLDPAATQVMLDDAVKSAANCDAVVVAAFVAVSAYRGNVALAGGFSDMVTKLTEGKAPVILVSLGNPYLLRSFPNVRAYLTTYSTVPTSEAAAVKALFGEIAISGHLPVSIPGLANYGDGIQLPAHAARTTMAKSNIW